jgi:predicted metal-binding transcription factor (methanogenesis marker protein 9)
MWVIIDCVQELGGRYTMATARYYQLKQEKAEKILSEMQQEISQLRNVSKKLGITTGEIEQTKRYFRLIS